MLKQEHERTVKAIRLAHRQELATLKANHQKDLDIAQANLAELQGQYDKLGEESNKWERRTYALAAALEERGVNTNSFWADYIDD